MRLGLTRFDNSEFEVISPVFAKTEVTQTLLLYKHIKVRVKPNFRDVPGVVRIAHDDYLEVGRSD